LDASDLLIQISAVHHPACNAIVALVEGTPPFIVRVPLLHLLDGLQGNSALKRGYLGLSSDLRICVSYKECSTLMILGCHLIAYSIHSCWREVS
jgi:hypothetical protein